MCHRCICVFNIPCYVSFWDKKKTMKLYGHIYHIILAIIEQLQREIKKNEMNITSINIFFDNDYYNNNT